MGSVLIVLTLHRNYTIMTTCLSECGAFKGMDIMLAVFKPVEFMCIEKRDGSGWPFVAGIAPKHTQRS
jgi:hypothetical protein